MILWDKINEMDADAIEGLRIEVMKEIQLMKEAQYKVKEEYQQVSKDALLLEIKKQELRSAISKASQNIQSKQIDVERLKSLFFKRREGF